MQLDLDNTAEEVRIEIIPLLDVIFCILTFFILAAVSLTRQQAIGLDLPKANTSSAIPNQALGGRGRLYVSLDSTGQVYIDQSPIPEAMLRDMALQHQQIAPNGQIVLYAAQEARYADVVKVLDILRAVGGDRVALATLPGRQETSDQPGTLPGLTPNRSPNQPLPGSDGLGDLNDLFPASPTPGGQPLPGSSGLPGSTLDPLTPSNPLTPTNPATPTSPTTPGQPAPNQPATDTSEE
ncbi:MAG: biopolymer transporter ExbD [Cyanobacteria bacterium P01_A01_bin.114]